MRKYPAMTRLSRLLVAVPLAALATGPASAAAPGLIAARPRRGGVVHGAPNWLVLRFSAPPRPAQCTVSVTETGAPYNEAGRVHRIPGKPDEIAIPLLVRSPGKLQVAWSATFRDGQTAKGRFSFTVAP